MKNYFLLILIALLTHCLFAKNQKPKLDYFGNPKENIKRGDIHIIQIGLPSTKCATQIDSLTHEFGFYFASEGCLLNDEIFKAQKKYNDVVIKFLTKRNGKNWYPKFETQLENLYKSCYEK